MIEARRAPCARLSLGILAVFCVVYLAVPSAAFFGSSSRQAGGRNAAAEEEAVDYYGVLGLDEHASEKEVRQRFRELSRKYHPDVSNTEASRAMYGKINRANEVLSDKKKRRMYDMRGEEGLRQLERAAAQGDQGNALDPFSRLFGFSTGNNLKGQNLEGTLHVSLATVYKGGQETFTINKQKVCSRCKGSGAAKDSGVVTCSQCRGRGIIVQRLQIGGNMFQSIQQACPHCEGSGKVARHKCPSCGGNKVVRGDVTLTMDIEQGMPEGHTVTFEMEADESPDMIPGDLVMTVHTKPHSYYTRRPNGLDLDATLTVTLKEALLGFERHVAHLDASDVSVENTGVTPFGTVLKIRGRGMPRHHTPSERGDLYVKVLFELPKLLTEAQKKEIEEHF
ncbi:putative chaperone DNAJ protein [Trypanosoma grayi]|uniref:putative chaperone DNAJ protein n=1 Tax=Trypanosoma grayi TaxID=71804 RepID=UPI0004F43A53|nr:putative chaperone DNAJ protein [Trypanosoma grayi]KEG08376.1 putative chaperone DNAJ protein [Trypanosoma grayi]